MIPLYHFTSNEAAKAIIASGFRDGEDGACWLSPSAMNPMGEQSRQSLLEVCLDIREGDLEKYRVDVVEEDVED